MSLITVIGRGHGGTRAMSHTLSASGVYMGEPLNQSGDLLPPQAMYEACRVLARHVKWLGGLQWDFGELHSMPIPVEFTQLIERYLATVLDSAVAHKGWKIPETTLVFPWIVRMFPEIRYIHWTRNPRDNILARHLTDDLHDFGIGYPDVDQFLQENYPHLWQNAVHESRESASAEDAAVPLLSPLDELRKRAGRAISWQYQYEIVKATPRPKSWIFIRFEDFILDQDATLKRLEDYLGFPLARIPIRTDSVGRYNDAEGVTYFDFLDEGMQAFGYEIPPAAPNP
jgi:hypothetical protein